MYGKLEYCKYKYVLEQKFSVINFIPNGIRSHSFFKEEKIRSIPKVENTVSITYVGISYWQLHQYLLGLLALYHEPNTRNCDFRTWMFLQQFFLLQNPTNPSLPSVEQSENVRKCLYLVESIQSRILPTCITMLSYLQTFT